MAMTPLPTVPRLPTLPTLELPGLPCSAERRLSMLAILALLAMLAMSAREARAEVLIRWDFERIPPTHALGIDTVVVPAAQAATIRAALEQGYRVYVEIEAASAATFKPITGTAGVIVKGTLPAAQIERLVQQGTRVRVAEDRGKWPHIRTN